MAIFTAIAAVGAAAAAVGTAGFAAAAATAVTAVGMAVATVGIGLTIIGAITGNEDLLNVGKYMGLAGGALAIAGGVANYAIGQGVGTAAAQGATGTAAKAATTETTASVLANEGAKQTAGAMLQEGGAVLAAPSGGVGGTAAGQISAGITPTTGTAVGGMNIPSQSWQMAASPLGPTGGAPLAPAAVGAPFAPPPPAAPAAPGGMLSTPAQQWQMPPKTTGPTAGAPLAPSAAHGVARAGGVTPSVVGTSPKAQSWWDSLDPHTQAMFMMGGGQAFGGMAGGLFTGMSEADKLELAKFVEQKKLEQSQEILNRGAYAPQITFTRPGPSPGPRQPGAAAPRRPFPQPAGLLAHPYPRRRV